METRTLSVPKSTPATIAIPAYPLKRTVRRRELGTARGGALWSHSAPLLSVLGLPVIGPRSVLAKEVLVVQFRRERTGRRVDRKRPCRHAGDVFEADGNVHRVTCALAPAERRVPGHEDRRNCIRVEALEGSHDRLAGRLLV